MLTPAQQRVLDTQIAPGAVACEQKTGIPAAVTAGQAILEAGWLLAAMPPNSNNCFGLKSTPHIPGRVLASTKEWFTDEEVTAFLAKGEGRTADLMQPVQVDAKGRKLYSVRDWFASFESLADCFAYHGLVLLGPLYAPALEQYQQDCDLRTYIKAIAAHYATAPNYAQALTDIATGPSVTTAINALRTAVSGY